MSLLEYAQLVLAGLAGVGILAASSRAAASRAAGTDAAFWYCFAGAAAALVPLLWAYSLGPAAGGTVLVLLLLAGIPAAAHVLNSLGHRRPVPPDPAWQPAAEVHAALAARWLAYELNPAPAPGAEVLTDPAAPATAAMVRALDRANRLRPDPSALPAAQRTSAYILAVAEFSRRLDEAEAAAGINRTAGP
ncbi:hypothetical protein [Arthrobacter mangrovi]|uniref:Uncharacterized protein n=1 Tax=Arthrobacter mangrovi TaxID=2966350 RepID=A0ABQ5MZJ2_9MICC|nr:hypothetical protein [Arthrobacter mangrovi]GLB69368.1 hypothetical protein AHIS1636_38110 [Arthrobacter mangrovi]